MSEVRRNQDVDAPTSLIDESDGSVELSERQRETMDAFIRAARIEADSSGRRGKGTRPDEIHLSNPTFTPYETD